MINFNFLKNSFKEKHTIIDNEEYLDKYINFLLSYSLNKNNTDYTEKHHILPVCKFPEYKNKKWNLIELKYRDHKKVHLWLFKAINIRPYQRPVNFMSPEYKNSKEISNAAKQGWVNLKNNKEKFNNFRKKRSEYMKKLSSEEQSRRANIFWKNINEKKYNDFCNKMSKIWTEEKRKEQSKKMLKYYEKYENIVKKSIETQNRWNNMSIIERNEFKEKMNKINKDPNKRKDASDKIKELWKDEDYLEKMKNRKTRKGVKIKVYFNNNTIRVFDKVKDFLETYNFKRKVFYKYIDSNVSIDKKYLTKENMILENAYIKRK